MKHLSILTAIACVTATANMEAKEPVPPMAGELISGDVFSNFRPVERWFLVGEAEAVAGEKKFETSGEGKVLVNVGPKSTRAPYLFTAGEFKDIEVRLEFMVPKGSNAGVYLMGRYEIQIRHDTFVRLGSCIEITFAE